MAGVIFTGQDGDHSEENEERKAAQNSVAFLSSLSCMLVGKQAKQKKNP